MQKKPNHWRLCTFHLHPMDPANFFQKCFALLYHQWSILWILENLQHDVHRMCWQACSPCWGRLCKHGKVVQNFLRVVKISPEPIKKNNWKSTHFLFHSPQAFTNCVSPGNFLSAACHSVLRFFAVVVSSVFSFADFPKLAFKKRPTKNTSIPSVWWKANKKQSYQASGESCGLVSTFSSLDPVSSLFSSFLTGVRKAVWAAATLARRKADSMIM